MSPRVSEIVWCFALGVLVLAPLSCVAQCGTTVGGHTFDFSALTHSAGTSDYSAQDAAGYTYDFNICGTSTNGDGNCAPKQGTICQYQGPTFVAVVAKWQQGTWTGVDPTDPTKGVKLSFSNGDACYPSMNPRQAQVTFTCDSNTVGTLSVTESNCNYLITFPTSYACVNSPPPPPSGGGGDSPKSGLSGGWIFVIILLVLIPIYIVAGCVYNHRKDPQRRVIEKCPNLDFWKGLPMLVKDGCMFTFSGIRRCFARLTGKGATDDYSSMK